MISLTTTEAVLPITERIKGHYTLSPVADSPLAALCHHSQALPTATDQDSAAGQLLASSKSTNLNGVCEHDVTMDEITEVVSASVRRTLQLTKGVVKPNIETVADRASAILKASDSLDSHGVGIEIFNLPSVVNNPQVREMVERYNDAVFTGQTLTLRLGDVSDIDTLKQSLPMSGGLGGDLEAVLNNDDLLVAVNKVFNPTESVTIDQFSRQRPLEDLVVIMLLAVAYRNDPPEQLDMGLTAYELYMSQIMKDCAIAINNRLRSLDFSERQGKMVIGYPYHQSLDSMSQETVLVHGKLYQRFIEGGGSPDAILGAWLSPQQPTTLSEIEANQERFEKAWAHRKAIADDKHRLDRQGRAYKALSQAMFQLLNRDMSDEELPVDRALITPRIEPAVAKLQGPFYENWYKAARQVVCEVIYPHTDTLELLEAIDRRGFNNPDMDPREVAYLGMIDYITHWVAQLINVKAQG